MVNKEVKKRMRDFVSDRFNQEGYNLSSDYVNLDNSAALYLFGQEREGALVLVYDTITGEKFNKLKEHISREKKKNSFVFLKDGKNFFRSWAKSLHYKRALGFSLKNYNAEQVNEMILLSPAEQGLLNLQRNRIQYYQPSSPRLEEGIVSFGFKPVHLDYSHIENSTLEDKDSKRIFENSPLTLDRLLVNVKR